MSSSFTVTQSSNGMPSEAQVGVLHPAEAFDQKPSTLAVTHLHVIVDGDQDEEVSVLSPWAGASSEASASSGIPSTVTQHRQQSSDAVL